MEFKKVLSRYSLPILVGTFIPLGTGFVVSLSRFSSTELILLGLVVAVAVSLVAAYLIPFQLILKRVAVPLMNALLIERAGRFVVPHSTSGTLYLHRALPFRRYQK